MNRAILTSILDSVSIRPDAIDRITIEGHDPIFPSPFLIGEGGAAALAAVGYAASELWFLKTQRRQNVHISVRNAALVQRSHQYLRVVDGTTEELWSPLSGFYQTQDQRWIQFHCNFPHHQQGVLDLLNCTAEKAAVVEAVKHWQAETLEEILNDRGMCAAMVRTPAEWQAHPQAAAIRPLPLFEIIKIGDSNPEPLPIGARPLSGIKVLDVTRVLAGPVCGKMLAEHGATVMRIASPHLPYISPLVMDTGFGKLSAYLDLDQSNEKEKLFNLIKKADVFSQAYRPGALAERGFSPIELSRIRPGIIYVELSAYSHLGPWANRHGYDSLVQSATGIAYEQGCGEKPQHLPAQSLDYISGFLAAFGIMEALRRRAIAGGSYLVRLSLAQTEQWFNALGRVQDFNQCAIPTAEQIRHLLTQTESPFGKLEHLLPILEMSETPVMLDRTAVPLGTDKAEWPKEKGDNQA